MNEPEDQADQANKPLNNLVDGRTLPIWELHETLRQSWAKHNQLVLIAPTGSGKTTQLCQMLLADWQARRVNPGKRIIVLQPRRVAARSVARRVAQELGSDLGGLVGYQVRFDDRIAPETRIAFITEGILLRWLQSDRATSPLADIGAVLFDEFHERSLMSDIALALCKQLQQHSRSDLQLIVMSATLEAQPVAEYLSGQNEERSGQRARGAVPMLESKGRAYPVELRYQSWGDDGAVWERAAQMAETILDSSTEGDVLIFMPGMYEIQRTLEELRRSKARERLALIPLHGELSPRDQDRVFAPSEYRRVIVATNVAETSLTIPGIRFVIDSGLARVARYDTQRGVNTLHLEPISQASADQRAGRAGRLGPGVCYRLWSEPQQAQRPPKNTPEIQRTELSEVVLLLHSLGIDDVVNFDFLDKPDVERIRQAEALLAMLGALAPNPALPRNAGEGALHYRITAIGRQMLQIPAHPRYARMLIEAQQRNCVAEVALMAALVSGRDLLTRINRDDKMQKRNRESLIKRNQTDTDFFLLANAFQFAVKNDFDGRICHTYGINAHVAREVAQAYRQLLEIALGEGREVGSEESEASSEGREETDAARPSPFALRSTPHALRSSSLVTSEAIQRCHLVGFVDHLAVRTSTGSDEFDLMGNRRATLMDESVVGRNMLIVASEIREITTRNNDKLTLLGFGSAVKPEWVRELNPPGYVEEVRHVYDRLNKRVAAGKIMRYHDLLIGGTPTSEVNLDEAARILAEEFVDQPGKLPMWNTQVRQLLASQNFRRAEIIEALQQSWHGSVTFDEIARRPILHSLQALLHNGGTRGGE